MQRGMVWRSLVMGLIALVMAGLAPLGATAEQPQAQVRIDDALTTALAADGRAPVWIMLRDQADTSFAQLLATKYEKGVAVHQALLAQAQRDQPPLLNELARRGLPARGFLSTNAISAEIDNAALAWLREQPAVAALTLDAPQRVLPEVRQEFLPQQPASPDAIEPGVNEVGAPQVWAQGYTGQGIVVAGKDTGVRWTHTALRDKYRGWNGTTADHTYSWHDGIADPIDSNPCGPNRLTVPCDDNGHGTHTVGTMLGDDEAANQIGVAPGATWIACRNMDAGNGTIATYVDCIDWMIAPYAPGQSPAEGLPEMAPDIINNSWGCPPSEGCSGDAMDDIQPSIISATNAGILFVASAGNSGSSCSTIIDPPALYPESFSVGAYAAATGLIASFSSRGPVTYQEVTRIGPDLSAPGVSVRSATAGGDSSYGNSSGTSMASPHVAGVAALLWSARPELRGQIELTRRILTETARPTVSAQTCGGVLGTAWPNNTFGHGKIDAAAAIAPTITGTVTLDGVPVTEPLSITLDSPALSYPIDANGAYAATLPSGTYTLTAALAGHEPISQTVTLVRGTPARVDFAFESPVVVVYTIDLPALFK